MDKKVMVGFIIWAIAIFSTMPKSKGHSSDIKEVLDLPSIKEMADNEVNKIQEEKALREREEQKRAIRKKDLASRGEPRSVPKKDTSMKSYMSYKKITNKSSKQYELQQRNDVYTDSEGFRKIGDRYIIAIGTYYSETIGDCIRVELSEGGIFEAIVGDIKDNRHTDNKNQKHKVDGSVIEFIVDTKNMDNLCKKMGNMSYATNANLMGDIVSIEILGNINEE